MKADERHAFLDNLRTFLIFLVVVVHAGMVYESSGLMGSFWIVDDPTTSDLPGLVNLVLDIFVMPSIFFISGIFAPPSLQRRGAWRFVRGKVRRLMLPWAIAVLTLVPLYKVIFLASRGLPQESWTSYFHVNNGGLGMGWLWFLPVLFLFDVVYLLLWKLKLPLERIPLGVAVTVVLVLSVASSTAVSLLGRTGWTKTLLVDFQNERMLSYLLVFLLGALCGRRGVFDTGRPDMRLYVALCATAWIPVTVYAITLLSFIFRPGEFLVSEGADIVMLWCGFHLALLALVYCALTTFRLYFDRQRSAGRVLGRLSYGVYVIHVPVLGALAMVLLAVDLPALAKYPALATATYALCAVLVGAYLRVVGGLPSERAAATEGAVSLSGR